MKSFRSGSLSLAIAVAALTVSSCKTKKAVTQPAPQPAAAVAPKPEPVVTQAPEPVKAQEPAPFAAPDYNFKNIQFEFNSGILKTDAYPILDKAAAEMKKDASVRFLLGGHSSAEGTTEHNMALSVERANAVKTYLVNTGISAGLLDIKGYGEGKPISPDNDEAGRSLNRRVEINKQ